MTDFLNLRNQDLYELPEIPIHITKLDISNNYITEITRLPDNVKVLDASNNRIKAFTCECKKLAYLNLSNNSLREFDFTKFVSLKYIDLSYNEIESVTGLATKPGTGQGASLKLWVLYLQFNRLKELEGSSLPKTLKILNCSNNQIEKLGDFEGSTPYLETLDCSYNNISELPKLNNFILKLNCSNNKIEKIEGEFPDLRSLNCSNNRLKSLDIEASLLQNVKYLDISGNGIEEEVPVYRMVGSAPVRSQDSLEFLYNLIGMCYDYENNKEVSVMEYMKDENSVLVKINEDHFGVSRKILVESGLMRESTYYRNGDGRPGYVKTIMQTMITRSDFEQFKNQRLCIYMLSRTHILDEFENRVSEGYGTYEIRNVVGYTLQDYLQSVNI